MQTYDESGIKSELHTSGDDPNSYATRGLWNYSVGTGVQYICADRSTDAGRSITTGHKDVRQKLGGDTL